MANESPFFNRIKKNYLTEDELNKLIPVVEIQVYGAYTCRGEHRKEVVEKSYEAKIEVPAGFNKGHIKLSINRYIKRKLNGIRAKTFYLDTEVQPKQLPHQRAVKDFMSDIGLRDNDRLRKEYMRAVTKRREEAQREAEGIPPTEVIDDSAYGHDGLPKFSERTYIAQ